MADRQIVFMMIIFRGTWNLIILHKPKKMKYLKFRNMDDIDEEILGRWILEGFYT